MSYACHNCVGELKQLGNKLWYKQRSFHSCFTGVQQKNKNSNTVAYYACHKRHVIGYLIPQKSDWKIQPITNKFGSLSSKETNHEQASKSQ